MIRTAIFVEGHGELIFVSEMLKKLFDYFVDIECSEIPKGKPDETAFNQGSIYKCESANYHFRIINVRGVSSNIKDEFAGGDTIVSAMNKRLAYLTSEINNMSYTRIVCLRDLDQITYRKTAGNKATEIHQNIVDDLKKGFRKSLKQTPNNNVYLCFATIELESWFLALDYFDKHHELLTNDYIRQQLSNKKLHFDLATIDPESTIINPASKLKEIFDLVNIKYDKKTSTKPNVSEISVPSLVSKWEKEDYVRLLQSGKCNDFKEFIHTLGIYDAIISG